MCEVCDFQKANGRSSTSDPIVCRKCHAVWGGNEAQHCVVCHVTFSSIRHAERHLRGKAGTEHLDPSQTEGWRETRPGVWLFDPEVDGDGVRYGIESLAGA